ncbi:MAG: c-type cytochrome domain-containing protein, partial [Verrucomicrobiota bacterium]|nr:c-type cytochrome domain-containing protein [Verrucomicrobiota bacterium]
MRFFNERFSFLVVLATVVFVFKVQGAQPDLVNFGVDVRPLLSHYCVQCHGPDEEHRKADLQLHTQEGLF